MASPLTRTASSAWWANMKNSLFLDTECDFENDCDGCGEVIAKRESHLAGIESCCGGCYRRLCKSCIVHAAALIAHLTF